MSASGLSTAEATRFERSTEPIPGTVANQLIAMGREEADAAAIAGTVEHGLPVLAGFGVEDYFADLEQRGLAGSPQRISGRYDHKINTSRWKQLVAEGVVPDPEGSPTDPREQARLLVRTNHLFYDRWLVSVDPDSVRVRDGTTLKLETGENFNATSSLSHDWDAASGVTVEFAGKLNTGQAVRVSMIVGSTTVAGRKVWGIASCAIIGTGQEKLFYPPF
jgi:hypothetical protein